MRQIAWFQRQVPTGPAVASARWITALNHKWLTIAVHWNNAVENSVVVKTLIGERDKVSHRGWRSVWRQRDSNWTGVRHHNRVNINFRAKAA